MQECSLSRKKETIRGRKRTKKHLVTKQLQTKLNRLKNPIFRLQGAFKRFLKRVVIFATD
jgi:hypothetical protein